MRTLYSNSYLLEVDFIYVVMLFINNDVILRSEGGGGHKKPKKCGHTLCMAPKPAVACGFRIHFSALVKLATNLSEPTNMQGP